jgi:hypothetical protein
MNSFKTKNYPHNLNISTVTFLKACTTPSVDLHSFHIHARRIGLVVSLKIRDIEFKISVQAQVQMFLCKSIGGTLYLVSY